MIMAIPLWLVILGALWYLYKAGKLPKLVK